MKHHLAQVNIATARFPLEAPEMREFVALLDHVNRLADASPGFVWRLKGTEGNYSADVRAYDDPRIIFNLSVWESVDALKAFTYRGDHGGAFRRRAEWFEPSKDAPLAMWWIPAGAIPTVEEAKERLAHLRVHGESPVAFSFRKPFPSP